MLLKINCFSKQLPQVIKDMHNEFTCKWEFSEWKTPWWYAYHNFLIFTFPLATDVEQMSSSSPVLPVNSMGSKYPFLATCDEVEFLIDIKRDMNSYFILWQVLELMLIHGGGSPIFDSWSHLSHRSSEDQVYTLLFTPADVGCRWSLPPGMYWWKL